MIFWLTLTTTLFAASIKLVHSSHETKFNNDQESHIRSKRSNIPCGSAFTPCDGRRAAQLLQASSRDQSSVAAVLRRDATAGQFVVTPQTRRQMLQAALVDAREEADRLFNVTEPALSNQGE